MIKILTQNGIENTNLDGARDGYFNSGGKDGISSGILNNGTLTAQGNVLTLDTCEMRIKGHRIVIDEPITKTISGFPTVDTNYQFIAKITYNDGSVTFDTEARPTTSLIQDDILNGNGTYEVVIGEFIHKTDGTIANLVQIMHVIFGGSGVPAGGTTGQVLKKKSGTDYDTEWGDGGASGTGYILKPTALNDNNLPNVPIDKFQEAIEAYKAGIDVFLDLRGIPSFAHNTKIATAYRYFNSASGESLSFQLTYEYGYTLLARNGAVSVFEGDYAIPTNMESPAFSGKFWGYEDSDSEVHVGWKYPVISGTEAAPFMATKDNDLVTKKYFDDNKTGVGVPAGGTTGQVLKKKSGTDYDTEWGDGGSGGGVGHKGTGEGAEIFNSYEGEYANVASGKNSHAEGTHTKALKEHSHAEGLGTEASGARSHAEGESTIASGAAGHAEGGLAKAIGSYSHAEGLSSEASGNFSHSEGYATKSIGIYSHAEGYYTKASGEKQHVQGKFNIEDTENKYAHIVGNGESEIARSNAHTLDWNGNAWYAGKVSGGTEKYPAPVEKPNDYVTKKYFEEMRKGGLPINEGNTLSKLYFDTNTTPDLSIFTYALDETYGLETCTLILAESGENSYTLAAAKVPTSEDGSTFVYALVYIGADGSLTPLYASGACSFNAIELSAGWQSFSNPLSVNEYPITIIDNVVGWNGVWVSKKAFLVDTDDLQNALILTSPNGTKYRIKVADDGTLSTEAVTA